MTNLDVFTLANAPFPYITSLDVFYDKLKVFSKRIPHALSSAPARKMSEPAQPASVEGAAPRPSLEDWPVADDFLLREAVEAVKPRDSELLKPCRPRTWTLSTLYPI